MGELRSVRNRCPVCGHIFRAPRVGSYVTVGRETDLCPKFPGRQSDGTRLIRDAITMCPACSFSAAEDFSDLDLTADERYDIEERLRDDGLLKVFRASPPPWLAFQLRALRYFIRALREEGLHGRELSLTTYLVGELNRRLGNHREALNWYVNAERTLGDEVGRDAGLAWLDRLISEQSKLAREQAA